MKNAFGQVKQNTAASNGWGEDRNMTKSISFASLLVVAAISAAGCKLPSALTLPAFESTAKTADDAFFDRSELSPRKAAEACIVTAEKLETAGHHREAIALYEKARQHDAEAIDYSRRLAVLYDKQGEIATATKEYAAAIASDPENPGLLNDFGYFHLIHGDPTAAESWFRRTLAVDPAHQRAANNLAMSLAMQNRLQESYEVFSRVVGPAAAYSNLGVLLTHQGRINEAREHFQRALAIDRTIHPAAEFLSQLDRRSEPTNPAPSPPAVQPASYRPPVRQ